MTNVETKNNGNVTEEKVTVLPPSDKKQTIVKGRNGRSCSTHLSNAARDLEYAIEMDPKLADIFKDTLILIRQERDIRSIKKQKTPEQLQQEAERILARLTPEQRAEILNLQAQQNKRK